MVGIDATAVDTSLCTVRRRLELVIDGTRQVFGRDTSTLLVMFYFTYGSNLDTEQMKRGCPGSLVRDVGRLKGYRLGFTCFSRSWGERRGGVVSGEEVAGGVAPEGQGSGLTAGARCARM